MNNNFVLDDIYEEKSSFDIEFDKQMERWKFYDDPEDIIHELENYFPY